MNEAHASVFIVDGDFSTRTNLLRLFRSTGYAVEAFSSATEFLRRATYERVSCLVLDAQLPGATGLPLQEYLLRGWPR